MRRRLRLISSVLASVYLAMCATSALADPPARVGRVSRLEGAVTVLGPDPGTADTVSVNYPAAAGMKFSSSSGSRAELDFGNARARIDGRTDLEIQTLDDNVLGLRLTLGSVDVRVGELDKDERITVGTSDGQVVLTKTGAYRIDAPGQGASSTGMAPYRTVTHVAVLDGVARIYSPHGGDDVFAGESVDIDAPHGTLRYGRADSIWLNEWADSREQEIAADAANAARYVDTDIAGVAQLSGAGAWEETPDYGTVWYPDAVPVDWAPYQYGTWTWVSPWGWTWVDDQPWGFAPFHYGRWVRVHGRWGWSPPHERHHRHIYAPALVTFVGDHHQERRVRPNGWIPLRPGETYTPPYNHGANYVRDINRDHGGPRDGKWDGKWGGKGGRGNNVIANDGRGNTGANNTGAGNTGSGVITSTMRLPTVPGDTDDAHRRRHRTGNDDSAPITITNETFQRRPQPSVPTPLNGVTPITSNPAGAAPGPVTPMTTNPAGPPPASVAPLPVAPRVDPATQTSDMNNRPNEANDQRRYWMNRNPDGHAWGGRTWDNRTGDNRTGDNRTGDPRNGQIPPPAPQQAVPQQTMPSTFNVLGAGRVQIPTGPTTNTVATPPQIQQPVVTAPQVTPPAANAADMSGYGQARATGNMGSAPLDNPMFNRMPRANPAGATPQIPTAMSPGMPAQPVYQPVVPHVQPPTIQPPAAVTQPAAQPPHVGSVFIPGVGNVPANIGRGNFGQGNLGAPAQ